MTRDGQRSADCNRRVRRDSLGEDGARADVSSHSIRACVTRYVSAVQEATNALNHEAPGALFSACHRAACDALSRAQVSPDILTALTRLGDPAAILAAVFLQKKCAEVPGFRERTRAESLRFVEAVSALDPMLMVWITSKVVHVQPAKLR